ncbi:MAG: CGNR zinc finger domain-containing protein [Streptomycetaceae bacterium]|nr:CGNR zinc finger domain-containing protein [Streptomycetaceae bacterium]
MALRRIEELVNTYGIEMGSEDLADPPALAAWLTERALLDASATVTPADLDRTRIVREGLRAMLGRNNAPTGEPASAAALDALSATARTLPLTLDPGADPPALVPLHDRNSVDAALARLLADVAASVAAGTWARMKTCREDDCRWAYYDHSRNRSRAWCSMSTCGNRAKARAFRTRER